LGEQEATIYEIVFTEGVLEIHLEGFNMFESGKKQLIISTD